MIGEIFFVVQLLISNSIWLNCFHISLIYWHRVLISSSNYLGLLMTSQVISVLLPLLKIEMMLFSFTSFIRILTCSHNLFIKKFLQVKQSMSMCKLWNHHGFLWRYACSVNAQSKNKM